MFSRTFLLQKTSVFGVFLRVLNDSNLFSTREQPDPSKPAWSMRRAQEIFRQLPPDKIEELRTAAALEQDNDDEGGDHVSDQAQARRIHVANRRARKIEAAEYMAFRLTQPSYVTSFTHFVTLNSHRVKTDSAKGAMARKRIVRLAKLFATEKENFQTEQLAALAKRRKVAEAWAKRAQLGLHDQIDETATVGSEGKNDNKTTE